MLEKFWLHIAHGGEIEQILQNILEIRLNTANFSEILCHILVVKTLPTRCNIL